MELIGREKESKELNRLYNSNKPELVAVYGRRRVGKTYLIDTYFADKITFTHTGMSPDELEKIDARKLNSQLDAFYGSLLSQGMQAKRKPKTWIEAFTLLIEFLESKKNGQRRIVFIDELPWLDTPRSNFIPAFGWFWNNYGCKQQDLMVIVCGSATSWIMNHLINAHGGLYGRLTYSIRLSPFTLKETRGFLTNKGIRTSEYNIALIDMILGGIPYYLNYYNGDSSIEENIDNWFFQKDAKLGLEFDNLFNSTFDNNKLAKKMVMALAKRGQGYTRKELLEQLDMSDGELIGNCLKALVQSDFIIEYVPYMASKNKKHYKVIDPFCLFYLKFVHNQTSLNKNVFYDFGETSWTGHSFENLCLYHFPTLKSVLGIRAINTMQFSWFDKGNENRRGSQIDLVIERKDGVINLCEMKFYNKEFKVDKDYHLNLMNKVESLRSYSKNKKTIIPTLVTTYGLEKSGYFDDFANVITLNDFFK